MQGSEQTQLLLCPALLRYELCPHGPVEHK